MGTTIPFYYNLAPRLGRISSYYYVQKDFHDTIPKVWYTYFKHHYVWWLILCVILTGHRGLRLTLFLGLSVSVFLDEMRIWGGGGFLPGLLRYNWHTALYKFKVNSIMNWLRYIMKWLPQNISEHPSSHRDTKLKRKKKFSLWWELLGFTLNNFHI